MVYCLGIAFTRSLIQLHVWGKSSERQPFGLFAINKDAKQTAHMRSQTRIGVFTNMKILNSKRVRLMPFYDVIQRIC